MKSTLGLAFAAGIVLAFGVAWFLAIRDSASFIDQQWLFFAALPYNLSLVAIFGDSPFSADAPGQVAAAALSEAAVAYLAGACAQGAARALWRALHGASARA